MVLPDNLTLLAFMLKSTSPLKIISAAYLLLLLASAACKKPYNPTVIASPNHYLVVEGVINSGNDSTIIKLSRTVNLDSAVTKNPVSSASVTVESDQNNVYPLVSTGAGTYVSGGLNLSGSQKYRLRIVTPDGQKYSSDFIAVKPTPPIDSIGYIIKDGLVHLYVNAHDPANNTRYYRWDFDETWIFHAKWGSDFVLDPTGTKIIPRPSSQQIFYCFGNDTSSNILLTSTAKLSKDVVYQSPLTEMPVTSEKLEVKYSILLRQYSLTPEAYAFYQNLKKNTEQLGSIFDAQPSQIAGNIHNETNAAEPVVGYMQVTNVQSKRIFLTSAILPPFTLAVYPYDCEQDTALYANKQGYNEVLNTLVRTPPVYIPTRGLFAPGGGLYGYLYSTPICVDCTVRGTTKTPSFWK